ncbi:MAG: Protease Do [Candidatus Berkelbacteria bacterium Licking1014_7]|uniref:Protease Do n=1 Tax=Candidatus Berkelbacteria bacterium Licking1014_7 TaxID=2017147 RepID=A0A554LIA5_9BACT|nr:MAG: Protease Do [Candidatus Berkelbacteria bacterium Licking1014_7]
MKIRYIQNGSGDRVIDTDRSKKMVFAFLFYALVTFVIGLLGGIAGLVYLSDSPQAQDWLGVKKLFEKVSLPVIRTEKLVLEESSAVIDAVKKASPSVVSISTTRDVRNFFGQIFQQKGGGTGFIITQDGMIITNKHVVEDTNATYTIFTSDGKDYTAKILARDSVMDLAVIKIDAKGLAVVDLGDSDKVEVGQWVIAIGNALGEFQNSVTVGVISAKERQINAGGGGMTEKLEGMLQTDAAINPGNSGGPLVNLKGQVVGVNTAVAQAENIGFAIPIDSVKNTIEQVKQFGKIKRPYFGVRYIPITKEIARLNNLKVEYGALVVRGNSHTEVAVMPGSPADKAGVEENDIILEIAGERIDENNSLARIIAKRQVGEEVEVKILRSGKEQVLTAVLEEMAE